MGGPLLAILIFTDAVEIWHLVAIEALFGGAGWAFLLDAATLVVSALMLARVRTSGAPPDPSDRRTLLAELAEGYREVRTRAWLWVTVAVFALAVPLGYAPLYVLGPTVAEETYTEPAVFGFVTAAYGAGALAGAPVALVLPLSFATGIGFALFDVFWNTTMAEQIPPHALSRASAWEWMGSPGPARGGLSRGGARR